MACCPYEYAKDITIREKWHAYRDKFSRDWAKYFGVAAWSCKSETWNCHGNERHGARDGGPEGSVVDGDLWNAGRARMAERDLSFYEVDSKTSTKQDDSIMICPMDSWASTDTGSMFNSLDDHMFAREEAMRQNADFIAAEIADIQRDYQRLGFNPSRCEIDLTAYFDRPIGTAMTQKGGGMKVHCIQADFKLVFDPRDNVLYEITGYPSFEESSHDDAIRGVISGRIEFVQ